MTVGKGVTPPSVVYRIDPEYTEAAYRSRFQGTVILGLTVNEFGLPVNIRVPHLTGLGLDARAVKAVSQWRFRPGSKDGRPVSIKAEIEVNFRIL